MRIEIKGMKDVMSRLDRFGVRARFAAAKALNEAAYQTMMEERKEIADSFDRPVPYIQRGVRMTNATNDNLAATVYLPGREAAVNVSGVLSPHIKGGGRRIVKASERRLRRFGFMGPDQYIVPGPGVPRDQYGNVSGPTMVKILSQVQAFSEAGYSANAKLRGMTWKRYAKLGSLYVIPYVGIFGRKGKERRGVPLLFFTNSAPQYEEGRFEFYLAGAKAARSALPAALRKHLTVELRR